MGVGVLPGVGVGVLPGAGVGVLTGVGVGVPAVFDGVGVAPGSAAGFTLGIAVGSGLEFVPGFAVGPAVALGVGLAVAPDGVEIAGEGPACPPPEPAVGWPAIPDALAPVGSQVIGRGSQFRPAPTKGSQDRREPLSQIRVPGPRPSTKKPSASASRRARRADVIRSRRVLQYLLPGTVPKRIVSVATSISLRNDGSLTANLR